MQGLRGGSRQPGEVTPCRSERRFPMSKVFERVTLVCLGVGLALLPYRGIAQPAAPAGRGRGGNRAAVKAGPFTRLPDGKPNFQGYWETRNFFTAFDLETHERAEFGVPAGRGVIVDPPDGKIPYQPWALEKKKDLLAHHLF